RTSSASARSGSARCWNVRSARQPSNAPSGNGSAWASPRTKTPPRRAASPIMAADASSPTLEPGSARVSSPVPHPTSSNRALLAAGTAHQDKVAQYLYNANEYIESVFACFKAGLVPVNTNYRYTEDELAYLWDNSDTVAVMFHGAFADRVASVRDRVPNVRL